MSNKTKPEIEPTLGDAPTELVITDLEVGDGAEATAGANVDVHYVGVDFETGEQFDASSSARRSTPTVPRAAATASPAAPSSS